MRLLLLLAALFALSACLTGSPTPASDGAAPAAPAPVGLANPASVHCGQQGGTSTIRTDADGNQSGVCVFGDGRECEEWALYRDGQCMAPKRP